MKNLCNRFSSEDISKFVDNELSKEKFQDIQNHISHCTSCKTLADNFLSMTHVFAQSAEKQMAQMDIQKISMKLSKLMPNSKPAISHLYFKLASIAVFLVISFFTFQYAVFSPTGPSAIVKSVDTDFASVMILETQKEKHTIIWFTET